MTFEMGSFDARLEVPVTHVLHYTYIVVNYINLIRNKDMEIHQIVVCHHIYLPFMVIATYMLLSAEDYGCP